jgi:threonyl-tRNA synthetase
MNIVLADGSQRVLDEGSSVLDAAKNISLGLAKKAVAGEVNGKAVDLGYILNESDKVKIITESDAEGLEILRHSTAHLMAQAVQRIYPDVKVTIGPVIKDGFYYDFDTGEMKFTPDDLQKIEKEMAKIAAEKIEVHRKVLTKEEAKKVFNDMGENYKIELIDSIEDPTVSLYEQGDFMDLCRGPHMDNTSKIKHYKLLSVAGAYWRGDEKNPQLQRIYGTSWFKKDELDSYLNMLEEAKKRDHRKIGKELKLFMVEDEIGAGFPIYLPKGGILRAVLEEYERQEHLKRGYDIVYGPAILSPKLMMLSSE